MLHALYCTCSISIQAKVRQALLVDFILCFYIVFSGEFNAPPMTSTIKRFDKRAVVVAVMLKNVYII